MKSVRDSLEQPVNASPDIPESAKAGKQQPGEDNKPHDSASDNMNDNHATDNSDASSPEQATYEGVKNLKYVRGGDGEPSVQINYPAFGIESIDAKFRDFAESLGQEFEKSIKEDSAGSEEEPSYPMWELTAYYAITRPNPHIVSTTFDIYAFTGGAHGNLRVVVMNYDLENGKELAFADLFAEPQKAVEIFSELSSARLRQSLGDDIEEDMLKDGTAPEQGNFENLALTPAGVTIEFQPYQVGPWSIGQQHVDISLEEMAPAGPSKIVWP